MDSTRPYGRRKWPGNGNEVVAVATSEAFARWLHHRHAFVELPSAGGGVSFHRAIPCLYPTCTSVTLPKFRGDASDVWY